MVKKNKSKVKKNKLFILFVQLDGCIGVWEQDGIVGKNMDYKVMLRWF